MVNDFPATVVVEPAEIQDIPADITSAIGHPDTAAVLSDLLGRTIDPNRVNVSLTKADTLFVFQLVGGRLPEGATKLPENFTFKLLKVRLQ